MDATSDKKTRKETWKRHKLFDRGFFYDDEISTNGLPDHVEALRKSILPFACDDFGQEFSGRDEELANQATDLTNREVDEEEWKYRFFRDNFFKQLEESNSASKSSWDHQIVFDANSRWVIFNPKENRLGSAMPDRLRNESAPQPDFAFYFPIHRPPANSPIPLETDQKLAMFSLSALRDLYVHGLRPSPFDPFQKNLRQTYLKCFPWLVVECKPKTGANGLIRQKKEEVYCQAVNGSGCAVRLNEIAALHETKLPDQVHISPIPAVTTVGPEVKVWITYLTENSMAYRCDTEKERQRTGKGYMMQCIWDGDMRNSHDIAKFRLILQNIYAWATAKFRPLLAEYLDQWDYINSDAFLNAKRAAVAFRKEEMESRSRQQSPEADETPTKQLNRTIDAMMSLNLNEAVTPNSNRDKSPASACSTPQSGLRRSARIKAMRDAQLSPDLTSQLERSALRLQETIAAGPSKRRYRGTKFLAGPIEVEVDGITSDEYDEVEENDESDEKILVWDDTRRKMLHLLIILAIGASLSASRAVEYGRFREHHDAFTGSPKTAQFDVTNTSSPLEAPTPCPQLYNIQHTASPATDAKLHETKEIPFPTQDWHGLRVPNYTDLYLNYTEPVHCIRDWKPIGFYGYMTWLVSLIIMVQGVLDSLKEKNISVMESYLGACQRGIFHHFGYPGLHGVLGVRKESSDCGRFLCC
ncbi:hypothetical protein FACUT_12034 [Fusarium acutatum]|uniref:Uncharacterized protein n=1 Tax=Fusarium acutatum TaxID=78861 RepID=A0A8H4JC65_9HYPO|nr:hypothetical protein FACUT_12034 [Fusarium acutatum]